jgi:hypothetical protein
MKLLKILTAVLVIVGCSALAMYAFSRTETAIQKLTLEILKTIPRMFLVLESQKEVAVATVDDGSFLMGPRVGHATASRRTYYGLDLEKVVPGDIEIAGSRVCVRLPDPGVLDSSLDFGSVQMFTKRSGFMLLRDLAAGKSIERELLDLLNRSPPEITGEDIRAQHQSFVVRLNQGAAKLFKVKNLNVEFR